MLIYFQHDAIIRNISNQTPESRIMPAKGFKRIATNINKKWFDDRLRDLDISQRGLAKLIGIDAGLLNHTLQGKRHIKPEEAGKIAEVLRVPAEEVFKHFGISLPSSESKVRITGTITARGEILPASNTLKFADAPKDLPKAAVAARVEDSTSPQYGWTFFYIPANAVDIAAVGKLSVCKLENGSTLIRFVNHGFEQGKYNLIALDSTVTENVKLISATPTLWVKP